jgi:urease accessory protein UreF
VREATSAVPWCPVWASLVRAMDGIRSDNLETFLLSQPTAQIRAGIRALGLCTKLGVVLLFRLGLMVR